MGPTQENSGTDKGTKVQTRSSTAHDNEPVENLAGDNPINAASPNAEDEAVAF